MTQLSRWDWYELALITAAALAAGHCLVYLWWRRSWMVFDAEARLGGGERRDLGVAFHSFWEAAIKLWLLITGIVVVSCGIWLLGQVFFADGKVTHCYVELRGGIIYIEGKRPWRSDRTMARALDMEGAVAQAKQAGCELE